MAEVRWKITADDSEARKKLQGIKRLQDDIQKQGETIIRRLKEAGSGGDGGQSTKSEAKANRDNADAISEASKAKLAAANATRQNKEEQLAFMQALRESRLAIQSEREEQARLKTELDEGKISMQKYREEMARLNLEEKKRKKAQREAREALNENSQYRQLNKQLGDLRNRSKDVLAEMFKLEGQGKKNTVAYKRLADEARGLVAQTQYLDKGLKKIDASLGLHQRNVGNYGSALDAISPQFARLNSQLAMMGVNLTEVSASRNGFKELGSVLVGVGRNIGAFLISPIGIAVTALTSLYLLISRNFGTIKEFNAGLINVSKTTGIAGAELTRLGDSIIGLSRSLQVVGTDKLLEYATVAGQLGVKGTQNILAFTEALAKLETASDITGEEGGANIARMLTLVDGGVQNVKAFGDEIVNLGNNFAATEAEILDNATQIAQNVGIYKIGRQEVLAFATATKSVGIEAELVGSTFGRTLGQFEKIIRTGKGLADLLKVVGGNEKELAERFKSDASGVFVDYIRGLNNIDKAGGSVNAALAKTGVVAIRDQRVIASLATNGFDVLTDAINKSTDAVGALDAEFTNKAGSLESQIGRIKIAWRNLVLDIENGEGVLGQAVVRMADGFATLLDRIAKLANPTGWNEFIASLTDFDKADMIRDMNTALSDAETTLKSLSSFDVSTANQDKLREKYAEIESATAALNKQYEAYKKAVNEGVLTEGGKARLDEYKRVLDDLSSYMWQLGRNIDPNAAPGTTTNPDTPTPEEDAAAKRAREAALNNQRQLQKQIDDLNRASLRATLEKDEQEVESVREKYRKIRAEIDKFRKDPKNKGFAVDSSGLSAAESREVAQVRYRQETTELVKSLNVQRELWQEYESWRLELGESSARERYSKELEIIDNFKANIKREIAEIGAQLTASLMGGPAAATLTGAEAERLKQLQDLLKQITDQEQKQRDANLRRVLTDYASFETKRVRLHKQAEEDMKLMDEAGRKRRKKALDDELLELYRTEIEGNERFQEFMKTADTAGSSLALSAMKHGKAYAMKLIDGMTSDPAVKSRLKKELGEFFDQGLASLEQENFGNVVSLVDGFGQLVQSAQQFDGTMSGALKTIGAMVSQVGQMAQTLGKTFQSVGGGLSSAGGYGAIIGAVVSVLGGIMEAVDKAAAKRMQAYNANIDYETEFGVRQMESITKALERQTELIREAYGIDRIQRWADVIDDANESLRTTLDDLKGDSISGDKNQILDIYRGRANTVQFQLTGNREYDQLIELINKGADLPVALGANTPSKDRKLLERLANLINSGNLIPVDFDFKSVGDITPSDIEEMYRLIDSGRLDAATTAMVQNLINQYELAKNALNEMRSELTGTTFQSITDEIVSMFEKGTTAAHDFADSFEKIMQRAIINSFKRKYLEEGLQEWYDDFAKAAGDEEGLSRGEIGELQDAYNSIVDNAKKQFDLIKEATGVDFSKGVGNSETGLRGGIERMTEQTASELTGLYRATYDTIKRWQADSTSTGRSMVALMNGQLAVLNSINGNTAATVARLDVAVDHLAAIVKNTNQGSSPYERGW